MDNVTLFYFHGFKSSGQSSTAKMLAEAYPNARVICPTYNTKNAHEAVETLSREIAENVSSEDLVVFVGTSLGAFFANFFSNKMLIPSVLINPCLDPGTLLRKHNPEHGVDCESFYRYYLEDLRSVPKAVVLGRDDEVIPYNTFLDRLSKYHVFIKENMGHRVSNISEIKDAVDEILNNSYL